MPQTQKENQEGPERGVLLALQLSLARRRRSRPRSIRAACSTGSSRSERPAGTARTRPTRCDLDRSMLDLVLGGARDLRRKLPSADQHKLDEYLDSVRSVERRIAAIEYRQKEAALEKAGVARRQRRRRRPPIEIKIPEGDKRSEYMQVMCDLNVLAFQTDTTRVSTYIGSTPNGVSYPELGFSDQHHSQTHHEQQAEEGRQGRRDHRLQHRAVRLHGEEDAQPARRRRHAARQLHHDVGLRPGGRQQAHPRKPSLHHRRQRRRHLKTGRFLPERKGNQGDLLTTLLACAGIPLDRPIGIATKQIKEMMNV